MNADPNLLNLFIFPFLVAAILCYLITPLVIRFAKYAGIIDDPKKNKHEKVIHTYPTPRGGGIALFLAFVFTSLLFLPLDRYLRGILAGSVVIVVTGFLDDKYNLNPYLRILLGFLAAAFPIASGIGISFISNPLGGIIDLSQPQIQFSLFGQERSLWVLSSLFGAFWIVFIMNMLNMGAKGVDGQLTGTVIVAATIMAILSLRNSADITSWPAIIIAAIIAGAYSGFLPWHIYPQKIMPAYGGSTLAGYLLAILSILSTAKVGALMLILGVPIIDTIYQMARRMATGRSPVWGDRGHLHHRLLDAGWSKSKVAIFYWLSTLVLGVPALYLNSSFKFYTIIGVAIALGGLILWLKYQSLSSKPQGRSTG